MNTQQLKNSKCIAVSNYTRRQKSSRLKGELIAFFSVIIYYMHLPLYYNFISAILKNYPYIIYLFRNNYRICKKYHKYIAFFSQR